MAEEEVKEAEDGAEGGDEGEAKGGKGPVKLLAAIVVLIATGAGIAMMAVPKEEKGPEAYGGPWSLAFFDADFVANTSDDNFSRYAKFAPRCTYFAYDQAYAEARRLDADFLAQVKEAFTNVVARYRLADIMLQGSGEEMALAAQLEQVAEPLLFPVHVGETATPLDEDPESGLRPGDSQDVKGTFRGPFQEHYLHVDGEARTIRLDDGIESTFGGDETDLLVTGEDGRTVYLNVTKLKSDFSGKVNVGVHGRIRRVHLGSVIAQ